MAQGAQLPAAPARTPGLPESQTFYDFAGWNGIDTKPPRPGIEDDKCAWCDNLMPLGPHNARAMPDQGPVGYTAPGGRSIIWFEWYGLASTIVNNGPHAIVFLDDGSAQDFALFPNTVANLAPAGTFLPPAGRPIGVRQYGTQLLTIATEQSDDSYWVWDGANLFGAGSLGPEVTILDGGRSYTSNPTVTAIGGSGTGATFTPSVHNNVVDQITVTNPGTGYTNTDPQQVALIFSGGGGPTSAWGTVGAANGAIIAIEILGGGSYTGVPSIVITDATGHGAQAVITGLSPVDATHSTITAITVIDCGTDYTNPTISAVGTGGGLNAVARLEYGVLNSPSITVGGGPYLTAPQVHFLSATGTGASATAIIDSTGAITGLDFGHGAGAGFSGAGYVNPTYVYFSGGAVASATVQLMPFGINGHAIESYQGRVWVTTTRNNTKTFGTAPASATNFSPGDGGFVFPATESVLKYEWSNLRQSNGFLYLAGDSSVNAISGVNTAGAPLETTFSNQNIDPQIGSPWSPSLEVYSRAVIMANPFGIHAIYGGAVQKISTPLDGIFETGQGNINPNLPPSSAIAEVFGVHVYMLLMPIIDPITGSPRNALLMWDGRRWWTASQNTALAMIRTNEWGSQITAWGTDGTHLFPLFQTANTSRLVTLRSKLWTRPGIQFEKKGMQLYAYWQANTNTTLNFTIDADNTSAAITQGPYTQTAGLLGWGRSRVPDNMGVGIGFTMTSTSGDFQLMDVSILAQERRLVV